LKAAEENDKSHIKAKPIRIIADFLKQTLNARRAWNDIFQASKENYKPRVVYLVKLSFIIEGEIQTFCNNQKLKEL
jgi:phage host-nuclease inhibitor protein Gam